MIKPIGQLKNSEKEWLTTTEAAYLLGKSATTMWRWAKAGKLGAELKTDNGQEVYLFPVKEVEGAVKRLRRGLPAIA